MNITAAWEMGYSGKGVVLSILDDGIEMKHPDLEANYDKAASWDVNSDDDDPTPHYNSRNDKLQIHSDSSYTTGNDKMEQENSGNNEKSQNLENTTVVVIAWYENRIFVRLERVFNLKNSKM